MQKLAKSGFMFLKELNNGMIILENKFTGLRLLYNENTDTFEVIKD